MLKSTINTIVEPVLIEHFDRPVLTLKIFLNFALEITDVQFSALFKIGANYSLYCFKMDDIQMPN